MISDSQILSTPTIISNHNNFLRTIEVNRSVLQVLLINSIYRKLIISCGGVEKLKKKEWGFWWAVPKMSASQQGLVIIYVVSHHQMRKGYV